MKGDFRLGDWLVQPALCRLTRDGRSIRVRAKVVDVLVYLAGHAGEVVSKDQLLNDIWASEAISESALTRTITELRQALGDHPDRPQVLETIQKRGYRLIAPVQFDEVGEARPPTRLKRRHVTAAALVAVVVVATVGLVWWPRIGSRPLQESPAAAVSRLTFEPGLQIDPSFSPDGRFIAYAANRDGNFDLWVRPVGGGDPVRVTANAAADWQPDWSPDGSTLLFRSERAGGGIFAVPAFGGHEERLTTFGYRPRWSADGKRFLMVSALVAGGASGLRVYVAERDGSRLRELVLPDSLPLAPAYLVASFSPNVAWHPDGRRVSYFACSCQTPGLVLFTFDPATRRLVRSGVAPEVAAAVDRLGLQPHDIEALAWSPAGDAVYFVGFSNTLDLWRVDVNPASLAIVRGPHRLTAGGGPELNLAVSRDGRRVAYAQGSAGSRILLYELDATSDRVVGDGRPITFDDVEPFRPDLTRDGRKLLFGAAFPGRADRSELRELPVDGGSARVLRVTHGEALFTPRWSPDGTRIAYRYSPADRPMTRSIRVLDVGSNSEWQLTSPVDGITDNAWDWSLDGRWIVASGGRYRPGQISIAFVPVDAAPHAERGARVVASSTEAGLWQAMLSPNGRWLAFEAVPLRDSRTSRLYVVSADGGAWIPITDGTAFDDKPRWSADGRRLYFLSSRGGVPNVWVTSIDPETGRTSGSPRQLTSFDGRTSLGVPHIAYAELALGGGRMALQVSEPSASIWMLEKAH